MLSNAGKTIIESDLSAPNASEAVPGSGNESSGENDENGIPGFSVAFGVAGLAVALALFKKLH